MKIIDMVLSTLVLLSGCTSATDYMVRYRSVPPFRPTDANELRAELTGGLPANVEIRHFTYHRRENEMRALVIVRGGRARDAVRETVRANPRVVAIGPGPEPVHTRGKSLVCFCSVLPFQPQDEKTLLAALRRELPPEVKPRLVRSRRRDDRMVLWITVRGNFGKEAVKFVIWRDPNLKLLQVEDAPLSLGP
jgi:hypothetical protein